MKSLSPLLVALGAVSFCSAVFAQPAGDFVERFDTLYNTLTIEKRGSVVEMRARSRAGEFLESAVDLSDPMRLVVPYSRTVYGGLFFQPEPKRVLMIGLGGAGIHRLFVYAHPDALLHTVELDQKVFDLAQKYMGFRPLERTPVTIMDGRMFVKRNREQWDWLILDAFRGGFVPPHLKTQEFYKECAARLSERGVFITNLHQGTQLFFSDLKTIKSVFPQVVLLRTAGRGNVLAFGVNYREPDITKPENWASVDNLRERYAGRLDLDAIRAERMAWPTAEVDRAKLLTDDFAPVEFLNVIDANNKNPDS